MNNLLLCNTEYRLMQNNLLRTLPVFNMKFNTGLGLMDIPTGKEGSRFVMSGKYKGWAIVPIINYK